MSGFSALTQMKRVVMPPLRDQQGITGLETAIILIAFVVVASAFAFTVLSTGIFSAEHGKETVYAGLKEARSSLEPRGSAVAIKGSVDTTGNGTGDTDAVVKITFVVSNAVAGEPVDLTPKNTFDSSGTDPDSSGLDYVAVISYTDENQYIADLDWTVKFIGKTSGDNLLEVGEKAEITVWLQRYDNTGTYYDLGNGTGDDWIDSSANLLKINKEFTLEMKPPDGAVLTIQRTTPARLDAVMDLN